MDDGDHVIERKKEECKRLLLKIVNAQKVRLTGIRRSAVDYTRKPITGILAILLGGIKERTADKIAFVTGWQIIRWQSV